MSVNTDFSHQKFLALEISCPPWFAPQKLTELGLRNENFIFFVKTVGISEKASP
jgi:hypothetical protein